MTIPAYPLAILVLTGAIAAVTRSAIRSFRAHTDTREKALSSADPWDRRNWESYVYALKKSGGWVPLWWRVDEWDRLKALKSPTLESTQLSFRECRLWAAVAVGWFVIPLIVYPVWWNSLRWMLQLLYVVSFVPWAWLFYLFIRALRGWRESLSWDVAEGCGSGTIRYIVCERAARRRRTIGWFVLVAGLIFAYGYFWTRYTLPLS